MMQIIMKRFVYLLAIPLSFLLLITTPAIRVNACSYETDSFLTIPAWYKYLPGEEDPSGRCIPSLGDGNEESQVNRSLAIGVAVLEGMLRASSLVALILIFWGAFKYITTQGNPENATKSRQTVINAAVGFAIVLVAAQVVAFAGRTIAG